MSKYFKVFWDILYVGKYFTTFRLIWRRRGVSEISAAIYQLYAVCYLKTFDFSRPLWQYGLQWFHSTFLRTECYSVRVSYISPTAEIQRGLVSRSPVIGYKNFHCHRCDRPQYRWRKACVFSVAAVYVNNPWYLETYIYIVVCWGFITCTYLMWVVRTLQAIGPETACIPLWSSALTPHCV